MTLNFSCQLKCVAQRPQGELPVPAIDHLDGDGVEILLIHRPKYGDWTMPKGKLTEGETDEAGALREVEEETGLSCSLGRMLGFEVPVAA